MTVSSSPPLVGRHALGVATLVLSIGIGGCATSPVERPDEPLIAEPPSRQVRAAVDRPVVAAAPRVPLPTGTAGVIARADLDVVLARAPARFLAGLDADPVVDGARFRGWRVRGVFGSDPRFVNCALRPGDLVTGVNGRPVERPEQFMDVWRALGQASELAVSVVRDGVSGTLRWTIDGAPTAPPAAADRLGLHDSPSVPAAASDPPPVRETLTAGSPTAPAKAPRSHRSSSKK